MQIRGGLTGLWNRMSSAAISRRRLRKVSIPKRDGSLRVLRVPTVSDRIAQTVVKMVLEPGIEPVSHDAFYGYRPGRSALDALAVPGVGAGSRTG